jgi:phage shock protein C
LPRKLVRDKRQAVVGGVAAGLGNYLDVDPVFVRLAFVLLAFAHGFGVLAYLVFWVVVPRGEAVSAAAGSQPAAGADAVREVGAQLASEVGAAFEAVKVARPESAQAQAAVGTLLVVGGGVLLAHNLGWLHWPHWLRFETLWPLLIVALGIGLILKSRRATAA